MACKCHNPWSATKHRTTVRVSLGIQVRVIWRSQLGYCLVSRMPNTPAYSQPLQKQHRPSQIKDNVSASVVQYLSICYLQNALRNFYIAHVQIANFWSKREPNPNANLNHYPNLALTKSCSAFCACNLHAILTIVTFGLVKNRPHSLDDCEARSYVFYYNRTPIMSGN